MILAEFNRIRNANSIANYANHLNMYSYSPKSIADFVLIAAEEAFELNELVVAVKLSNDGYWTAYRKPVPPDVTIGDLSKVVATGNRISKLEAESIFKNLDILKFEHWKINY